MNSLRLCVLLISLVVPDGYSMSRDAEAAGRDRSEGQGDKDVVRGHRHGHMERPTPSPRHQPATTTTTTTTATPIAPPKRNKCHLGLPKGCVCIKSAAAYSITCQRVGLETVPDIEVGQNLVKTLNFEQNNLTSVKIGAFFGLKVERLLLANNSISELDFLAFWGLEFHLDTLDLSYNAFRHVPSDALHLLRNLQSLSLTGNQIVALRDFDFSYLIRLKVLALDKNPISHIADHSLTGTRLSLLILNSIDMDKGIGDFGSGDLKFVKGLSLAANKIRKIQKGRFTGMKSLRYLCLDDNRLDSLAADVFDGAHLTLQTLEMNDNRFARVPSVALRSLHNLESVEFRHNRLTKLSARSFNSSRSLRSLDLSYNVISKVSPRAFVGLDNILRIDLRHNELITLDDRTFYWDRPQGIDVYLSENPWLCNCLLKWMKRQFRRKTAMSQLFADPLTMRCTRPFSLQGRPIARVHLKEFTCDHDYYYYYYADSSKGNDDDDDDDDDDNDGGDETRESGPNGDFNVDVVDSGVEEDYDNYHEYDEYDEYEDEYYDYDEHAKEKDKKNKDKPSSNKKKNKYNKRGPADDKKKETKGKAGTEEDYAEYGDEVELDPSDKSRQESNSKVFSV